MVILYGNAIVTIDGFSLYQSLRACRNQLAKGLSFKKKIVYALSDKTMSDKIIVTFNL